MTLHKFFKAKSTDAPEVDSSSMTTKKDDNVDGGLETEIETTDGLKTEEALDHTGDSAVAEDEFIFQPLPTPCSTKSRKNSETTLNMPPLVTSSKSSSLNSSGTSSSVTVRTSNLETIETSNSGKSSHSNESKRVPDSNDSLGTSLKKSKPVKRTANQDNQTHQGSSKRHKQTNIFNMMMYQGAKKPKKQAKKSCPICSKDLQGLSNTDINSHVDKCVIE